jgi:hypothetical protein
MRKGHRQGSAADTPVSVCTVYIVSSPVSEQIFAVRPFASVVQTTTLLVVSIRQENPACVDMASTTTRL